jgi:uncharacterized protein
MVYTVFAGHRRLATGSAPDVARAIRERLVQVDDGAVLVFDDDTGRQVDLELSGTIEEIAARYAAPAEEERRPGPGRPKLGVVSREVSLLPRHWDWLGRQPGGASAALRRLVDAARRDGAEEERVRTAQDAAYRFMHALAGDLPGFEEASRALYAADYARLDELIQPWPGDVRDHVRLLLLPAARGAEE